jgi:hypothetical protein
LIWLIMDTLPLGPPLKRIHLYRVILNLFERGLSPSFGRLRAGSLAAYAYAKATAYKHSPFSGVRSLIIYPLSQGLFLTPVF